jgi:hypothetical protein
MGVFLFVSYYFILLASGTSFDVVCDPLVHPWPLFVLFGFPDRFISPRVSRYLMVMDQGHNGAFLLFREGWFHGGSCFDEF